MKTGMKVRKFDPISKSDRGSESIIKYTSIARSPNVHSSNPAYTAYTLVCMGPDWRGGV